MLHSLSVSQDFTMTLYLRHYWQDDRLAFPSSNNKSRTFDARLVKKIWVPDVFFVHSKRSFIHDTTMENIMLRVFPDGNILYSVRWGKKSFCYVPVIRIGTIKARKQFSGTVATVAKNRNYRILYWICHL